MMARSVIGASIYANQILPSHVLPHSVCWRALSRAKKFMSFSSLANLAVCSGWRSWIKSPVKQKTHQEVGYRSMFALGATSFYHLTRASRLVLAKTKLKMIVQIIVFFLSCQTIHKIEYTVPTPTFNSLAICLIPIPFSRSN